MHNDDRQSPLNSRVPRRTVLRGALGASALAAGGALSGRRIAAAQTPSAGLPADAAAEQVLRVQTGSSGAASFDFQPLQSGSDQQNWQALLRVPPMYFDVDLNLQPCIVDSWTPNADFTVWTLTIDPRAVWSDGTPITAADFKGTYELMADPLRENGRISGYMGNVKGFQAVLDQTETEAPGFVVKDDRTLEVQLEKPDPLFHWRIATIHLVPVKVEQAKEDPDNFWKPDNGAVSSGPYVIESFDADQGTATLVKNPNWWMDSGPYLDRIDFKYVTDPSTVALMVQNNEVDCGMQNLPPELKDQFPGWFQPIKAFGFNVFWLCPTVEPTDDANVRKALTLAVNFQDVFNVAFPIGGGTFATQLIDPDLPCVDPQNTWYPYDPDGAKAALAASTYGSAENLPKLRVTPRGVDPVMTRALESVIEFWRQNLGITNVEFQQQPDAFGQDAPRINLSRDDVVIRFPDSAQYMWTAAHSAGPIASGDMLRGYKNPEVDSLIEQAQALAVDDPQRCELSLQSQQTFLNDFPTIFFGITDTVLNAGDYVANYFKGPDVSLIEPWNLYIKQH